MIWADLHIHSRWSDGSQSVEEIFREASRRGLDAISITDHDTTAGTGEALHWGKKYNVRAVSGIEISAYDHGKNRKIHILGYDYDTEALNIKKLCDPILEARNANTLRQIKVLHDSGYSINEADVREAAGSSPTLYKQHIMLALMKKGISDKIYSALYRKLFKENGICSGDIKYVNAFRAIEAILKDNGRPVLAHPGLSDCIDLIPHFAEQGLWGIELNHEGNALSDKMAIKEMAKKYNLALTGGSDNHGTFGSFHGVGDIVAPGTFQLPERNTSIPRMVTARRIIKALASDLRHSLAEEKTTALKENDPANLISNYDLATEKGIVAAIRKEFPLDGYLAEETEADTPSESGYLWIIDPIDGTTNFVHRKKDFAISIACYLKGKPYFGLIIDVLNNDLYEGIAGKGAWINGTTIENQKSVRKLEESLLDTSLHTMALLKKNYSVDLTELAGNIRGHRAYGCASLILCQVALGLTDIYLSAKLHIWDYAAAAIILKETNCSYLMGVSRRNADNNDVSIRKSRLFIGTSNNSLMEEMKQFLEKKDVVLVEKG